MSSPAGLVIEVPLACDAADSTVPDRSRLSSPGPLPEHIDSLLTASVRSGTAQNHHISFTLSIVDFFVHVFAPMPAAITPVRE
jgi:hypothetical protein